MSRLALTEARFQANVLAGEPAIGDEIEGPDAAFRDRRLGIYRNAYRLRLAEVLGNDYGILRAYLGEEAFGRLANEYLAVHPSTFRNVRWFGGALAPFLTSAPRYAAHPELAELARFEWAMGEAFDAPDEAAATFEQVAAVPPPAWGGLRFAAHPSLRLLEMRTNAVAIWKALGDEGGQPPQAERLAQPLAWGIWRREYSPFFRSLAADEAWAAAAMAAGTSFGELCAGLCGWVRQEDAPARAAGLLRGWISEGWIAGLSVA
ncbi:MAG TPA: DNA-binding domain-containing protein [Burkholderiales bacterium]|nr:DNA-binding domain-containing protein [Burkholderiales bacterium]